MCQIIILTKSLTLLCLNSFSLKLGLDKNRKLTTDKLRECLLYIFSNKHKKAFLNFDVAVKSK